MFFKFCDRDCVFQILLFIFVRVVGLDEFLGVCQEIEFIDFVFDMLVGVIIIFVFINVVFVCVY